MNIKNIIYLASVKSDYSRIAFFTKALKKSKYNCTIITSNQNSYILRIPEVIIKTAPHLLRANKQDTLVIVGFMSQLLMPFVKILWSGAVFNEFFLSMYDTIINDRASFSSSSLVAKITFWLDKFSLEKSNIIITDTSSHATYYQNFFKIKNSKKFKTLLTGADSTVFKPLPVNKFKKNNNSVLNIGFHGSFIPLQGVKYILKAAHIIQNKGLNVEFYMIGNGPTFRSNVSLAKQLKLKNVVFLGRKKQHEILQLYKNIHLGLGVFGKSDKARRVIPYKVYEVIAMRRPVLSGKSRVMQEYFKDRENIIFAKMGDPEDIANKIEQVVKGQIDLDKISQNGYNLFKRKFEHKVLEKQLIKLIDQVYVK